jgi:hypothetical protein
MENWTDTLNDALLNLHETVANAPLVRIVPEKKTALDDMGGQKGFYCYDFHIEMTNSKETKTSMPMRFSVSAKDGSTGALGVRCALDKADTKPKKGVWQGETIHKNGMASCWTNWNIGTVVTITTQDKLVENAGGTSQRIWAAFSVILTDRAFLLFQKKGKHPKSLISFISMEDVLQADSFKWFTNGWREDFEDFTEKSKWDNYLIQTSISKPSPSGKIHLLDYFIQNSSTKDVRWFMPNIYATAEHKLNNHTEYIVKHNNLSVGETQDNTVFMCLIDTLPIRISNLMAVRGE